MFSLLKNAWKKPILITLFSPWYEFVLKDEEKYEPSQALPNLSVRNDGLWSSYLKSPQSPCPIRSTNEESYYHVGIPKVSDIILEKMNMTSQQEFLESHSIASKPLPCNQESQMFSLSADDFPKKQFYYTPTYTYSKVTPDSLQMLANIIETDDEEMVAAQLANRKDDSPLDKFFAGAAVVALNQRDFETFLKNKKHALVIFYSPYCPHCQSTKPEFSRAAQALQNDQNVAFAAVDCTKHQSLCDQYNVQGYPTMLYFSYFRRRKEYQGGRTADDFIKFMHEPKV